MSLFNYSETIEEKIVRKKERRAEFVKNMGIFTLFAGLGGAFNGFS